MKTISTSPYITRRLRHFTPYVPPCERPASTRPSRPLTSSAGFRADWCGTNAQRPHAQPRMNRAQAFGLVLLIGVVAALVARWAL